MYFVFGPGIVMLIAAAVLLVAGIVMLIKLLRTDWNMSVSSFNARFVHQSSMGLADMQQDIARREAARRLGVQAATPVARREISIKAEETGVMSSDRTEEL